MGKKTGEGVTKLSAMADEAAKNKGTQQYRGPYRLQQGGQNKVHQLSVNKGKKYYG